MAGEKPIPSEEEMQRLVWPSILELQKLLVERVRGTLGRPGEEVAAISFTSCDHHSCQ